MSRLTLCDLLCRHEYRRVGERWYCGRCGNRRWSDVDTWFVLASVAVTASAIVLVGWWTR